MCSDTMAVPRGCLNRYHRWGGIEVVPIAIVGRRYHGLNTHELIEWIEPDNQDAIRLVHRIKQRFVRGVVLIHCDLAHRVSVPIMNACKLMGVSLAVCGKRSQTQIESALGAITLRNERQ